MRTILISLLLLITVTVSANPFKHVYMREIGNPRMVKVNKKPASFTAHKHYLMLEINERVGFFIIIDHSRVNGKSIYRARHPDGDIIYFTATPYEVRFEYAGFEYILTNRRVR